jgi:hypothetical protein
MKRQDAKAAKQMEEIVALPAMPVVATALHCILFVTARIEAERQNVEEHRDTLRWFGGFNDR